MTPRRHMEIAALVLAMVGVLRICATIPVFNNTVDEPAHVAAGLELLDEGTYTLELLHPPLARVATAIGPYLLGCQLERTDDLFETGTAVLYGCGDYRRTLIAARLGIVPFFLISVWAVWRLGLLISGPICALTAAFLLSFSPTILAHSALATTDAAFAAMATLTVLCLVQWLAQPTRGRLLRLAAAATAAALCKFTALPFLGCAFLVVYAVMWWQRGEEARPWRLAQQTGARDWLLAAAVALVVAWAAYGFNARPTAGVGIAANVQGHVDNHFEAGSRVYRWLTAATHAPVIPRFMGEIVIGLRDSMDRNSQGPPPYLLGDRREGGWWYYFLVALGVKSTLGLLALTAIGGWVVLAALRQGHRWTVAAPLLCAAAFLGFSMTASLNIGVRHVLPVYAMLALLGGQAVAWLLGRSRWTAPVAVVLLAVHGISSLAAHPDYLPYFNVIAGRHPERFLADSNLDWGQDLDRLGAALRERGIERVGLAYFGTAEPSHHDLPEHYDVRTVERQPGWLAVSVHLRVTHPDQFEWTTELTPVARVGRTIDLYYVADR